MQQRTAALVLVAMVAGGGTLNALGASPAVRPEDAAIRALIASGIERSVTFRDLNTRLDNGDVTVYVRFSPCTGVPACLVWAGSGAGSRRLLVKLDRFGRSPDELTALLAHELQHANEVASAPDVIDLRSFQKAFASRGWKHGAGFETEEATRVTKKVAAELAAYSAFIATIGWTVVARRAAGSPASNATEMAIPDAIA